MEPESRKRETLCEKCGKAFWAWGSGRTICRQCSPDPPSVVAATLRLIESGKAL